MIILHLFWQKGYFVIEVLGFLLKFIHYTIQFENFECYYILQKVKTTSNL